MIERGAERFPGLSGRPLRSKAGHNVTQLHYARKGIVTSEMDYIAIREGMDPEVIRSEVATGRAITLSSINHSELTGARGNSADLLSIGESERESRGAELGSIPGHAD